MSELIGISPSREVSRRAALRRIAGGLFAAGLAARINPAAGQHVHKQAAEMKGALAGYQRQALTEHEWRTVSRLAELIVPADKVSPSAVDAGAAEFIDLLCGGSDELAEIYHGGVAWMDATMRQRDGSAFVEAAADRQTALLDELVELEQAREDREGWSETGPYGRFSDYQAYERSELGAGVTFFDWVRKMSVDAYYTSPAGVKDLGYQGNGAYSTYEVPAEAIAYALKRSGLG